MKGVAFELEFLVFLGKKTVEKNLVFLGVFFERRLLLSLRTYNNWKIKTSSTL